MGKPKEIDNADRSSAIAPNSPLGTVHSGAECPYSLQVCRVKASMLAFLESDVDLRWHMHQIRRATHTCIESRAHEQQPLKGNG